MADQKTRKMSDFYSKCQKMGYTNMRDNTQSLKAKVIATDMGLSYGNIVSFYDKAKACYDQVQQEAAAEKALWTKRQVPGELLVTLATRDEKTQVQVYIRPDGSTYYTVNEGSKVEGTPGLNIKEGGAVLMTYHPSKAVYMSMSYGGVTTGGVHHTTSGYTAQTTKSGKGDIEIVANGKSFTLATASFSDYTCGRFRYDKAFRNQVSSKKIKSYIQSDKADFYYSTIKTGQLSYEQAAYALTAAADETRLSYVDCEKIVNLLGRVIHGLFPPSVEELYASAIAAEATIADKAATSAELQRVIEMFSDISSYKDSAVHAGQLRRRSAEVVQTEKEQAVLKKEKTKKLLLILGILLLVTAIAAAVIANWAANKPYREIEAALNSESFSAGWAESNGYKYKLHTSKGMGLVAEKLGVLHKNDRPEEALDLLAEVYRLDIELNGEYYYASDAFLNWLKETIQQDGTGTVSGNDYEFTAYGHEVKWNSSMLVKQLYLRVDRNWYILTVNNTSYKVPTSSKVQIP